MLQLRYLVSGDIRALRVPRNDSALRTDGLWQHTCCELFVGGVGSAAYCEYNFSPSGAWAAYGFTGYRAGMCELAMEPHPHVECAHDADSLVLTVRLQLPVQPAADDARRRGEQWRGEQRRVGLTAVIETTDGALSYWALQHPAGRADFHDAAGHRELEL
jgi:hypothetical protein